MADTPHNLESKVTLLEMLLMQAINRLSDVEDTFVGTGTATTVAGGAVATSFTGVYWFKGTRYELSGTAKAYWYHSEEPNAGYWSDGPMPSPMPDMQYWRATAECNAVEYISC